MINHSKKVFNVTPQLIDFQGTPRVCFITKRAIATGEEIFYDYGHSSSSAIKAHPWLGQYNNNYEEQQWTYNLSLFMYHRKNLQWDIKFLGFMYDNDDLIRFSAEFACSTTWLLTALSWGYSAILYPQLHPGKRWSWIRKASNACNTSYQYGFSNTKELKSTCTYTLVKC